MKTVSLSGLMRFAREALMASGVSETDSDVIAQTLVTTDSFGVLSHGTKNLYQYIQKMQAGGLNPKAVPTVDAEGPAWAILNGNQAMGMEKLARELHAAPRAKGAEQIFLPGEMDWAKHKKAVAEDRLALTDAMEKNLKALSEMCAIPIAINEA